MCRKKITALLSVCFSYFNLPPQSHISSFFFPNPFCHSVLGSNLQMTRCTSEHYGSSVRERTVAGSNDSQAKILEVLNVSKGFSEVTWTWCLKNWKRIKIATEGSRRELYDLLWLSHPQNELLRDLRGWKKSCVPLCVPFWSYRATVYVAGSYHLWSNNGCTSSIDAIFYPQCLEKNTKTMNTPHNFC